MLDIEHWSKQRVHDVMLELLFSSNYWLFLLETWAKQHCPDKAQGQEFQKLSEEYGRYQAKRLEKYIDIDITEVDRVVEFVRHSHWCAFEDIQLTPLPERKLRMRTYNCTAQKAARKWGLPHYDCGRNGLRIRTGFFGHIAPTAQVERVFTPPDQRPTGMPPELACEWLISF